MSKLQDIMNLIDEAGKKLISLAEDKTEANKILSDIWSALIQKDWQLEYPAYRHLQINFQELGDKLGVPGKAVQVWVDHGAQPPYLHVIVECDNREDGDTVAIGGWVEERV